MILHANIKNDLQITMSYSKLQHAACVSLIHDERLTSVSPTSYFFKYAANNSLSKSMEISIFLFIFFAPQETGWKTTKRRVYIYNVVFFARFLCSCRIFIPWDLFFPHQRLRWFSLHLWLLESKAFNSDFFSVISQIK